MKLASIDEVEAKNTPTLFRGGVNAFAEKKEIRAHSSICLEGLGCSLKKRGAIRTALRGRDTKSGFFQGATYAFEGSRSRKIVLGGLGVFSLL